MTELRDAALYYARWRGWAVFPVRPRAKEPLVAGAYKAATAELEQVEAWWATWPDANIGLATGERSGVWVLDIDGPEGFASFDQLEAEHGEVPDTQWASTGKGSHLYWQCPAGHDPGRRIGVRPGIDYIGGSGYLVLPPSIHPNGREYVWADADTVIPVAPEWLFELQRPKTAPAGAPRIRAPRMRPEGVEASEGIQDARRYLDGVIRRAVTQVAYAVEGGRNDQLYRQAVWAASVAAGLGSGMGEVEASLRHAARRAGLEDHEIDNTLRSAMLAGAKNPMRGGR
jgi:hypothetical protein